MASFIAITNTGPFAPWVTTTPNTSGDWEFARWLSVELNQEEIPSDRELAQKLFVELNREALGIPNDGALVHLDSDDKGDMATGIGEVAEGIAPNDKEEEGAIAPDGSLEQNAMPLGPPSSN